MNIRAISGALMMIGLLSGCSGFNEMLCAPHCRAETRNSSSLVSFLYPDGQLPAPSDAVPQLHLPLRVGLAFLPSQSSAAGLDDAHKEQILERIRERFAARKFVADIVIIPDYYLATSRGFDGLNGVQRLYGIDLMALVSYDQVTHLDQNHWSLGYLTIVGAYVLQGSSRDTATLVDLAVVDPATRTLVLRAGGTDTRGGSSTLIDEQRAARADDFGSFDAASDRMIANFDAALTRLEAAVHEGKARVKIVSRTNSGGGNGGGGAIASPELAGLLLLAAAAARRSVR
jgi:rhombotail lipoprotein